MILPLPWDPSNAERDEFIARLYHPDAGQLLFQIHEIFDERLYLRHGIDVEPGAVVLDVGANIGVTAAFFSHECGAAVVHSFEPAQPTFELLARNVAGFPGCVAHNYGLSGRAGSATLAYYPRADGMSTLHENRTADEKMVRTVMDGMGLAVVEIDRRIEGRYEATMLDVELRTLADVFAELELERVDLLKIDVERAELEVLRGMADADWPKVRQVVVEVDDTDSRLAEAIVLLDGYGFEMLVEQEPALQGTPLYIVYARR